MSNKPKFQLGEVVKIVTKNHEYREIYDRECIVDGFSENELGKFGYGIFLSKDEYSWFVMEDDIESTGRFATPDYGMTGESIKVVVTKEGEGMLKEEYERLKKEGKIKE